MVFSSFTFIALFLPIVLLLHYASKNPAWRNGVLLLASLFFYAWGEPRFVLIMLLSILVNYASALLCQRSRRQGWRAFWTGLGVVLSLAFLFWFKYYAFLVNSVCALFGLPAAAQPKTLPIGISFYTFQIITYTVDVYRGKVPAQRNLGRLALYISFFPQLIAGPIVNYTDVEPQLARRKTGWGSVYKGLSRFIIGLGKKVLIANVCGEILSKLTLTGSMSVLSAWLGAIAFSFQIYFDFSGYSDMAIGLGRMFGFRFKENFRYPYISQSVTEFWRRWPACRGGACSACGAGGPSGGRRCAPPRSPAFLPCACCFWRGRASTPSCISGFRREHEKDPVSRICAVVGRGHGTARPVLSAAVAAREQL